MRASHEYLTKHLRKNWKYRIFELRNRHHLQIASIRLVNNRYKPMNFVLFNYTRSNSLHFTPFILTNASQDYAVDRWWSIIKVYAKGWHTYFCDELSHHGFTSGLVSLRIRILRIFIRKYIEQVIQSSGIQVNVAYYGGHPLHDTAISVCKCFRDKNWM